MYLPVRRAVLTPRQGASTLIDNVTKEGKKADGFIVPAGSMFPLGCAIPNHTVSHYDSCTLSLMSDGAQVLQYGAYFPPGTMVSCNLSVFG